MVVAQGSKVPVTVTSDLPSPAGPWGIEAWGDGAKALRWAQQLGAECEDWGSEEPPTGLPGGVRGSF